MGFTNHKEPGDIIVAILYAARLNRHGIMLRAKCAGNRGHLYLGHPEFEGFEVVDGATVG